MASTLKVDTIESTTGTSYLSSGTLDNVAIGSSVTGIPSAGWIKLQTVTASNDATVTIGSASLLTSTYRVYKILGSNLHTVEDGRNGMVRLMHGGSAFTGSHYYYTVMFMSDNTNSVDPSVDNGANSFLSFWGASIGNAAYETSNLELTIYDPVSTTNWKHITVMCANATDVPDEAHRVSAGYVASSTAVDGIQFYLSSGNIASGYFTLYGLS